MKVYTCSLDFFGENYKLTLTILNLERSDYRVQFGARR